MAGRGAWQVTVSPAPSASDRALIEALFQFYLYDFSEMEPPQVSDLVFEEDGRYRPFPPLATYWAEDGRWPLLIRADGRPAGFALINQHSHLTDGHVERNMGEFFVARKYRGGPVAAEALRQILALHPGRWEVAVVERNARAKVFWPRAIAACNVRDLEQHQGDGKLWTGPVWSFFARD